MRVFRVDTFDEAIKQSSVQPQLQFLRGKQLLPQKIEIQNPYGIHQNNILTHSKMNYIASSREVSVYFTFKCDWELLYEPICDGSSYVDGHKDEIRFDDDGLFDFSDIADIYSGILEEAQEIYKEEFRKAARCFSTNL